MGVLGCFFPHTDSCSITGKHSRALLTPRPEAESLEVGLSQALADLLPAARLYKSPRATRHSTQGCPRGLPAWRSSAASSFPPSVPPAPSACWAPSSPWMSAGKLGGGNTLKPFAFIPLTKLINQLRARWGGCCGLGCFSQGMLSSGKTGMLRTAVQPPSSDPSKGDFGVQTPPWEL